MDKLFEIVANYVIKNYYRPIALVILIPFLTLIMLSFTEFSPDNIRNKFFIISWSIVIFTIILIWVILRRKKSNVLVCPYNKVGIIIAIQERDNEKYEELKYNFIEQIQSQLDSEDFWVRILGFEECRKILSFRDAENCVKQLNCNIIIFGKTLDAGKDVKLDLNAVLIHPELEKDVRKDLAVQLTELLPRVSIHKDQLIEGFNITSNWVSLYSSYFVGLATLWSHKIDKAQSIFERLNKDIGDQRRTIPVLSKIRSLSREVLYEIYLFKGRRLYYEYSETRSRELLNESRSFILKANDLKSNTVSYLLMESIYAFLMNRDVPLARRILLKVSDNVSQKHYSTAFLNAYQGKINQIFKTYRKAFKLDDNDNLIHEIIQFIKYIVKSEPDKISLHVCLALIYNHKKNYFEASECLTSYIELSQDAIRNPNIINLCKELNINMESNKSTEQIAVS
ncbi:hypothetical protein [Paenibacillus sedimenti]|uniref:Tetratricopeptide repeat protein n=1 Tax=Paenibacillus sedimenti TaxID=2770274 RepID=A0A926QKH4_9BACL|nr:hypothetical protein [Paenibacillus sedimenti]MBD0381459.1 hypothetical protein [Paenibacillus sedimenti]